MLRNYLKIALRNLFKHKAFSAINILGLAIGLAIAILILLWVKFEFSYDEMHVKKDRIYRLGQTQNIYIRTFKSFCHAWTTFNTNQGRFSGN